MEWCIFCGKAFVNGSADPTAQGQQPPNQQETHFAGGDEIVFVVNSKISEVKTIYSAASMAPLGSTVKPRYSAPAFNIIPPIEHLNFGPEKYLYSYLYVGNSKNFSLEHDFDQSLEMRYSGVQLYYYGFTNTWNINANNFDNT